MATYFGPHSPSPNNQPRYTFGTTQPDWWRAVYDEVTHTRSKVSLIDLTSFTKLEVRGKSAAQALDWLCGSHISAMDVASVVYTTMLNRRGGVEADITITRLAAEEFIVIAPTAAGTRLPDWMRRGLEEAPKTFLQGNLTVRDVTGRYAVLAVMGPQARLLMERASAYNYVEDSTGRRVHCDPSTFWSDGKFPFGTSRWIEIGGVSGVRAQRITYVGELGWELYIPFEMARTVYTDCE